MKDTLEERFKKRLFKIGRKNRILSILIIPILFAGMFVFHTIHYFRGNTKRFAMIAFSFLLFSVYSSFSFPIFTTEKTETEEWLVISDDARDISLAEEAQINLEEIDILNDEDVRYEDELTSHGMDIVEQYSALDILDSAKSSVIRTTSENDDFENYENYVFSKDDWKLVLINVQHSIPSDYEVQLGTINTMKGPMQCDERIIDELLCMIQDAKEENIVLSICSPYRDLNYQKMLFNRKINRYMKLGMSYMEAYQLSSQAVTVPGASEHQIGLALDIVTDRYVNLDEGFGETAAGIWLAENSYKYGFILRYPLGKEYITGIEYEPWHFRYVGVEAATVITKKGITLEEFWEDL